MTNAMRHKPCNECGVSFFEGKSDSNLQWEKRSFCSSSCANHFSSKRRRTDIFMRLEAKQVKTGDSSCWGWSGGTDSKGYAVLSNRRAGFKSPEKAHRVSYELHKGEIPEGMVIRHICDNPICTNPNHLEVGTQKENMRDCSMRNRLNPKSLENLINGAPGYLGAAVSRNKVKNG